MEGAVGPMFSNMESNCHANGFDPVNTPDSGASSTCLEYGESKNSTFLDVLPDEVSSDKMVTENLNSTNGDWNNLCNSSGLPSARPMICVRKTEDLFGIPGNDLGGTPGDKGEFSVPESAVVVKQDPVQQVNTVINNFLSQPALSQFDSTLRAIGSEVVAYPVNPMIRPIQEAGDGPEPKQRRTDVKLPSRIRLPDTITVIKRKSPQSKKKSVEEMLANRDVTVSSVMPQSRKLTPSVSINSHSYKAKSSQTGLPTVDLTKESENRWRLANRLNRRSRGKYLCQICDKMFTWPAELTQHMTCHRASRLVCKECTAQYPTEKDLEAHRAKYHGPPPDLAIPVVDLQQSGVLEKLGRLGIRSVIPLAQLHSGTGGGGGTFGLPVVAVSAASNPALCHIGHLGASNILSLGPLKTIAFDPTS